MKSRSLVMALLCGILFNSAALSIVWAEERTYELDVEEAWEEWLQPDEYYTLVDRDGQIITQTGRRIYVGDEYLNHNNFLYRVTEVDDEGYIAYADLVERVELEHIPFEDLQAKLGLSVVQAQEEEQRGRIATYHTHNAESYVPTDGTDSINGKGGIHHVGAAFAKTLHELGVVVDYSEDLHLPHDRGAYRRSRETVVELLANKPDAIFDIHRDAAPEDAYALQVEDEWVTQVQFVVGRQNQNLAVNREFAQSMKSISDEVHPGLVKGIFYGRGNYNQDLTPLSLLLEVGAHTNSRDAAERGVSLFAEVVDFYFYGPRAEAAGPDQAGLGRTAQKSLVGLLVFVIACVVAFYVINAGGWSEAWARFKRLLRLR